MKEKTLKEELREINKSNEIVYLSIYNNGKSNTDEYFVAQNISSPSSFTAISSTLCRAAKSYAYDGPFDKINMHLLLGLVYEKKYVNKDNTLKACAKPINGIVRFYTGSVDSFLGDEKTNKTDYYRGGLNRQGFIKYDELIAGAENEGLIFNGPQSFEEFEESIHSGETFDISVTAILEQEKKLAR